MGEEWRRGWHPEIIEPKRSDVSTLVVGAGPAGLECAMQLARRGYHVTLAEASSELGGRALREARLKGLSAWRRVSDNRVYELERDAKVDIFLESRMSADQLIELGIEHVFIATGSHWRRDGIGRSRRRPISNIEAAPVFTPDEIMDGVLLPAGPIVIYDDDQGYLGGVIADHLCDLGHAITFVTPASQVSPWTVNTLEQERVQRSLMMQGVDIRANRTLRYAGRNSVETRCIYSGRTAEIRCNALILVTERLPNMALYHQLMSHVGDEATGSTRLSPQLLGDALAPGLIADAVYSGHLAARNFETDPEEIQAALYRREMPSLAAS